MEPFNLLRFVINCAVDHKEVEKKIEIAKKVYEVVDKKMKDEANKN